MYIDFDDYPLYSGRISENFEKIVNEIFSVIMVMLILKAKIKSAHGLMSKVER